jgi:hypothetical protein
MLAIGKGTAAPLWFKEKGVPVRNPFTQHVLLYTAWLVQQHVEVEGFETISRLLKKPVL